MVLSFLVDKQIITRVDKEKVVRDSMNYLRAQFQFSPDWTGQKTAVFKSKSGAYNVLIDDDGSCLVPWEVLVDEVVEVSAFCGALITANVVKIITIASGYEIGEEGREPTPDVYTQIMEKLSEIEAEVDPEALQALIDAYLADKGYVTEADVETIVAAYVDEHKSEWQGSTVEVTPTLQTGTKIAEIEIDGTTTNLYAPAGGGGASSLSDLTDTSISTPAVGDVLVYDGEKWENAAIEGIEPVYEYEEVTPTVIPNKYIKANSGDEITSESYNMAEISVNEGETYTIVGTIYGNMALCVIKDANGNVLYSYPTSFRGAYFLDRIKVTIPAGGAKMYSTMDKTATRIHIIHRVIDSGEKTTTNKFDPLYGKKWYALGDSFTFGYFSSYVDSHGKSGQFSDAFDNVRGCYKTYPWYIQQRCGINANTSLSNAGIDFTNVTGAQQPFSSESSPRNYTMIPADCDYITLAFGLNETDLTTAQIGTSADTTNDTLWGAYNVVLESILTANPKVKIGIIICDAWMTQTYHDALIEIAKYWGIPYLDLKNGEQVPMMIDGELRTHSAKAETLRNSVFKFASNGHPTLEGHEYRSTVIENFLRSL